MTRSRELAPKPAPEDEPADPPVEPLAEAAQRRRAGAIEGLVQELIRRTASIGFSSFFLTEEAVRRALSETIPEDWVDFVGRQGSEARKELVDRLVAEFGAWLQRVDPAETLRAVLDEYEISLRIDVSTRRREPPATDEEG